ncbi:MAG: hypothetical protein KGH60_03370 [Candidatus Micrarchaeota archaeon]|nr:hypothetical protein [Candidatus Micrarchaeota archaeon]
MLALVMFYIIYTLIALLGFGLLGLALWLPTRLDSIRALCRKLKPSLYTVLLSLAIVFGALLGVYEFYTQPSTSVKYYFDYSIFLGAALVPLYLELARSPQNRKISLVTLFCLFLIFGVTTTVFVLESAL